MGLVSYCPRCGRIYRGKAPGIYAENEKCDCKGKIPFYKLKEKTKTALIKTDIESMDWQQEYCCDPVDVLGNPESLYHHIWEGYVDTEENNSLNKEAFNAYKEDMRRFFEKGGHDKRFRTASAITKGPKCRCKWG